MSGSNAEAALQELLAGVAELPSSLTIPLEPPIEIPGIGKYDQLVVREPTADEVRQAEEQLRAGEHLPHARRLYQIHLVAKCSGAPVPIVQKLGVAKLQIAYGYVSLFLGAGLGIGAR